MRYIEELYGFSSFFIDIVDLLGVLNLFGILASAGGPFAAVFFVLCAILVCGYKQPTWNLKYAMEKQRAMDMKNEQKQYIHDICRQVTNNIKQVSESQDYDSADRLNQGLITMQSIIHSISITNMDKILVYDRQLYAFIFLKCVVFLVGLLLIAAVVGYFAMATTCLMALIRYDTGEQLLQEKTLKKEIKGQQEELRTIVNGMELTVGQILTNNNNPSVIADNYKRLNAALELFNTKLESHKNLVDFEMTFDFEY